MKYLLPDGNLVEGDTHGDVVEAMATYKLVEPRSRKGYRTETARRTMEMYQKKIDPSTDETFVESMVEAGLLEPVQ